MVTSPAGIEAIKHFESCFFVVYSDPAGLPTIGWGHLITPEERASGKFDGGLNEESAEDLLRADLLPAEAAVNELVDAPISQGQFDALVSLAFNIGRANFETSSVLRLTNARDYENAGAAFLLWDKAHVNGKLVVFPGLYERRKEEARRYLAASRSVA